LLNFFKKKSILFSDVLKEIEPKVVTNLLNCHFYHDVYGKVYECETNLLIKKGDKIKVIEYHKLGNIIYRNEFTHTVE